MAGMWLSKRDSSKIHSHALKILTNTLQRCTGQTIRKVDLKSTEPQMTERRMIASITTRGRCWRARVCVCVERGRHSRVEGSTNKNGSNNDTFRMLIFQRGKPSPSKYPVADGMSALKIFLSYLLSIVYVLYSDFVNIEK